MMSKGKHKDWRHRVTRLELAERQFINQQMDRIVAEAHTKSLRKVLDEHRARMEEASAWVKDTVPKIAEVFIHNKGEVIGGFVSEESMKRIFGGNFMPLGVHGAIIGDLFLPQLLEFVSGDKS